MATGTITTIILIAIIANVALMSLIVIPVLRRRRERSAAVQAAPPETADDARADDGRAEDARADDARADDARARALETDDTTPDEGPDAAFVEPTADGLASAIGHEPVGERDDDILMDAGEPGTDMDTFDHGSDRPGPLSLPDDGGWTDDLAAYVVTTHPGEGAPNASPAQASASTIDHGPDPDALSDPVTGLDGPAAWSHALAQEGARASRYRRPVAVVITELDGIGRLEERFGQGAGDRLIPPVAEALRRNARSADTVARLDRVRFGLLLPETDEIQAINLVERIRSACDLWLQAGAVAMRPSIGWASPPIGGDLADALREAEERMYREQHRPAA